MRVRSREMSSATSDGFNTAVTRRSFTAALPHRGRGSAVLDATLVVE